MKLKHTLWMAAAFGFAELTLAAPAVPPQALGQLEATVSFCSRVDSASADKYKELIKPVIANMSEKELSAARGSTEYKDNFKSTTEELLKLPTDKAVASCREGLKQSGR